MPSSHLNAHTIAQPGGLYDGVNNALLQAMMAYIQHKDRSAQEEHQAKRDERTNSRQQLRDALADAERYGVAPRKEDAGWIQPGSEPLIEAARGRFDQNENRRVSALADDALAHSNAAKDRELNLADRELRLKNQGEDRTMNLADRELRLQNQAADRGMGMEDRARKLSQEHLARVESGDAAPVMTREEWNAAHTIEMPQGMTPEELNGFLDYQQKNPTPAPPAELQMQWDAEARGKQGRDANKAFAGLKAEQIQSETTKNLAAAGKAEQPKPDPRIAKGKDALMKLDQALASGQPTYVDGPTGTPITREQMQKARDFLAKTITTLEQYAGGSGAGAGAGAGASVDPTLAPTPEPAAPSYPQQPPQPGGTTWNGGPTGPVTGTDDLVARARALSPQPATESPNLDFMPKSTDSIERINSSNDRRQPIQPEQVRAMVERFRRLKGKPPLGSELKPTDAPALVIARYVAKFGGTPEAAAKVLRARNLIPQQ